MSQLGKREPDLVGAALASGNVCAGLIADAVHVHPETMRAAWQAKRGPGQIYLVSDTMAVAGSDATEFDLGGRLIRRRDGILTLEDVTLEGADWILTTAVRTMVQSEGVETEDALRAATKHPANVVGLEYAFGKLSGAVRLAKDLYGVVPLRGDDPILFLNR